MNIKKYGIYNSYRDFFSLFTNMNKLKQQFSVEIEF